mmetsp:Transcript_5028/g.14893  ORF Transcript_5028/g.14893 Transcript_5028/m.14893 type:complete len:337 (-) Transcript_5028:47-1057(-)
MPDTPDKDEEKKADKDEEKKPDTPKKKKEKRKTVDAVDPKRCPNYSPIGEGKVQQGYRALLPKCYTPEARPAQVRPNAKVGYLVLLGKIVATVESSKERRRFILHYPAQAPFEAAVMFDVADPAKTCPRGLGPEGAPMLVIRFVVHDPKAGPQASQAQVRDFYRHQRDGFITPEAAVVPLEQSVVGMGAPSLQAVQYAIGEFEKCHALLTDDFKAVFEGSSLRPSLLVPPSFDFSRVGPGAHVELRGMSTPGYDGLTGRVLAPAMHPDTKELYLNPARWAVMPFQASQVARALKLRGETTDIPPDEPLKPLAIVVEKLAVVPEPEDDVDEGIEECD